MKFGLGTVQLGMPYGISNTIGQPGREDALIILRAADDAGVDCFDTASSYGSSEELVGAFLTQSSDRFHKISTKIRPFQTSEYALVERQLQEELNASLARLGGKIDYLLFHRAHDLIDHAQIIEKILTPYQRDARIGKVGVSIYSPEEVLAALRVYPVEVIQSPLNVLDHRILAPEVREEFREHRVELHARSIYLQGLLCMETERMPPGLARAVPYVRQYQELCIEYGLPKEQVAFAYVRDLEAVDRFFVGCESLDQLKQNIAYLRAPALPDEMRHRIDRLFQMVPVEVIDPSKWRLLNE